MRAYQRAYYAKNYSSKLDYAKEYRAANLEKVRAAGRAYGRKNKQRRKVWHASYYKRNADKLRAYQRDLRKKKPEAIKANKRRYAYGISAADYEQMKAKQGGRCAICASLPGGVLHVDHQHGESGRGSVRGLLCNRCNLGLGLLGDGKFIDAASAYLKRPRPLSPQAVASSAA
jgi:hypothetical protein